MATIARGEFMAGLQQMLTPACADATYILRSCFNASEAECVQLYGASLRACIEDPALAIPERIPDTEEAGQHYGELIGVCAGQHYAASMDAQARRTRAPECNQQ